MKLISQWKKLSTNQIIIDYINQFQVVHVCTRVITKLNFLFIQISIFIIEESFFISFFFKNII